MQSDWQIHNRQMSVKGIQLYLTRLNKLMILHVCVINTEG